MHSLQGMSGCLQAMERIYLEPKPNRSVPIKIPRTSRPSPGSLSASPRGRRKTANPTGISSRICAAIVWNLHARIRSRALSRMGPFAMKQRGLSCILRRQKPSPSKRCGPHVLMISRGRTSRQRSWPNAPCVSTGSKTIGFLLAFSPVPQALWYLVIVHRSWQR